jgi:hypothetical protein
MPEMWLCVLPMNAYTPKVMCSDCGFFHEEEPGAFDLAQSLGATCRVFGCFGHMIPFDAEAQRKLAEAHAPIQEAREAMRPQIRAELMAVMRGEKPVEWLFRGR